MIEDKTIGSSFSLFAGDCLEVLKRLPENSVDSICTDPPYGLKFMGARWDYDVPSAEMWREALRVLKPGGHLLSFGGTRTYHRMAVNIEDAGFQIRDQMLWVYGSGFPKSHNISKAIDKAAGVVMETRGHFQYTQADTAMTAGAFRTNEERSNPGCKTPPTTTDSAKQWDGWGTALKPAHEPICLAQKPISEKTIAANVLRWGTGAINVDGCRIGSANTRRPASETQYGIMHDGKPRAKEVLSGSDSGRFPSNLLLGCAETCTDLAHDMFECPIARIDEQSGLSKSTKLNCIQAPRSPQSKGRERERERERIDEGYSDKGGASRFFYCAKASKRERNEGCEGLADRQNKSTSTHGNGTGTTRMANQTERAQGLTAVEMMPTKNHHPTVKPIALMRYLCRLITPPGGTILDPFCGSGSTGISALKEGFKFVGVEREPEYLAISKSRIEGA
ncbi:MAG: DNA methyltransferase [Pseudomonadota bacterium]